MKIFIDTNIFLDLLLKREGFEKALLIFNAIEKKLFSATILDITILNIDYIASKQVKDIKAFLNLVNKHFEVVGATNEMIDFALQMQNSDLEDNLQYICAKKQKCECIITNDKNFYSPDIEVLTSSEFSERI
ncbi:MAG: PIN domain-containing protein [Sulfurimonas sp.]|uniref:type II toxin-antitoxin system VapC family toxin n=1 Tax=Sulfurimonas sp. TaxID=2022749 RepID=UPI00262ACF13|nr:PIN domain-containing protein [Sulfurimonas sp.]MDD5399763.1 PIN domain-containing protein [Sulfurimonas sp.]